MKSTALVAFLVLCISHTANAAPAWSQISIATTPSNAPEVLAAADAFLGTDTGKEFSGKLLLQINMFDGDNPATHTFVPIFKTAAGREAWGQKLQASADFQAFIGRLQEVSQPVSTVLYSVVESWGDINDTDHVWVGHAFDVSDPAAFLAALDALLASETGKEFPGQAWLSAVRAGGISPVSHLISVGYDSETEMDAWLAVRNASADWAAYLEATQPAAEFLGTSISRDLKWWGPATLQSIAAD